jgi:SAM-dependent methyltransferase
MEIHSEPLDDVARYIQTHRDQPIETYRHQFEHLMACLRRFRPLDSHSRMLEIGTGCGWFPTLCGLQGIPCQGLEISPGLIEFAKEYGRRHGYEPDIRLGNIEQTELGEEQYDAIIASSVFEHVQDWKPALAKVCRALRPGGVLFFESTNKWSPISGEYWLPFYGWLPDALRYRLRIAVHGPDIMKLGIDFHQFTYAGLRRAFREAGFSRWYDRVELVDPAGVGSPLRRNVLRVSKNNRLVHSLVLTFFESTSFICVR